MTNNKTLRMIKIKDMLAAGPLTLYKMSWALAGRRRHTARLIREQQEEQK